MRKSLIASFVLHGAILVAALVVLPNPEEFKVKPQDSIEVDISQITDESKRKATAKVDAPPEKKAAPKKVEEVKKVKPAPKVAPEVKTAAKEPVAPPPPEAKKPDEPKKVEPKPLDPDPLEALIKQVEEKPKPKEEVKKAEVKPEKKVTKKKVEKKKTELDMEAVAAFLNKEDTEKTAPQQPAEEAGAPELAALDAQGTDDALAATLTEALSHKLQQCWSVPPGAREANITVKVRWHLSHNGNVTGTPEILNMSGDPLFVATANSAVSAVMECQSYSDIFPQDRYDLWKDNVFDFNPNMMFGT
jgi:outer membrane biosynthesis protein TonB